MENCGRKQGCCYGEDFRFEFLRTECSAKHDSSLCNPILYDSSLGAGRFTVRIGGLYRGGVKQVASGSRIQSFRLETVRENVSGFVSITRNVDSQIVHTSPDPRIAHGPFR